MGKVRDQITSVGLKEFVYITFMIFFMYTLPTLLYKEYRKNGDDPKKAAAAMYMFVIPIAIFIIALVYTAFTGYVKKTTIVFIVVYVFQIAMPYVSIGSIVGLGIGYVVIVLLGAYAGRILFDSFGKKAVDKVNDLMDKADEKSLAKQKKKMAVKLKEEAKTEGIKNKAMKSVDIKKKNK